MRAEGSSNDWNSFPGNVTYIYIELHGAFKRIPVLKTSLDSHIARFARDVLVHLQDRESLSPVKSLGARV